MSIVKAANRVETDAHARKDGYQSGLGTRVVHPVNDEY